MTNEIEMQTITVRVLDIIATSLRKQKSEIKNESRFIDDLGVDSIDQVELILALEEEFELNIEDEVAEKLIKVQDVLDFIEKNVKN